MYWLHRTTVRRLTALALTSAVLCAGCSGSGSSSSPTPSGSRTSRNGAAKALVTSSPDAASPSVSASPSPYFGASPPATCVPSNFISHSALAGGAIQAYLYKPYKAKALPGAEASAARKTAVHAASYAYRQLTLGVAALKGCPSTTALAAVSTQTAGFLKTLSGELAKPTLPATRFDAANTLFGDIQAQANRIKITLTPTVPSVAQLTAKS